MYCVLFFALCLIPLAGMVLSGPSEPVANEAVSAPPQLAGEDGTFNSEFLQDLSEYIDHRFAFRPEMITANRTVHAVLLRDSTEEDVILGKDGWLFYADTLHSYEGLDDMSAREIWCAAHILSMVQDYCREQGAEFRFVIAPNKNTLYGRFMPDRFPEGNGPSELEELSAALSRQSVQTADVLTALGKESDILYRRHDSHWTSRGAGLAGDVILSSLGQPFTPFYGGDYEPVREEPGDLYTMLYPAGTQLDRDERYTRPFSFSYDESFHSAQDVFIRTSQPGAAGDLLMFRDSFGDALHPFLAEAFGSATFCRQNPYDLGLIAEEGADTVVIELVERNLRWLIERPAVFPAPEAEVETDPIQSEWTVQAEVSTPEALPGYGLVTGVLTGIPPDTDSPIYIRCGSVWYEASPTGEQTFAAYIPLSSTEELDKVAALREGQLTESSAINYEKNGGDENEQ